jgi:hypothetical protein
LNSAVSAFRGFQNDVTDKAVADDDIGRAFEDVIALNVAVEIQNATRMVLAQQLRSTLHEVVALDILFADIEQADRGFGLAFHG